MYGQFPSAFNIPFSLEIGEIPPALEISVKRPDGLTFVLYYNSLDSLPTIQNEVGAQPSDGHIEHYELSQRLYSSSKEVIDSLMKYSGVFNFSLSDLPAKKLSSLKLIQISLLKEHISLYLLLIHLIMTPF